MEPDDESLRRRPGGRRWIAIPVDTPAPGLPAWVMPDRVVPSYWSPERRDRVARYGYYLTEAGLDELYGMLNSGRYRFEWRSEGALLEVAWLLRAGDRSAALKLLRALRPFADTHDFVPKIRDVPPVDPSMAWLETAARTRNRLRHRPPNERVAAMREALTVWNPFADALLSLWCDSVTEERVAARMDDTWHRRAAALLDQYRELATAHTRCGKHRKRKENLGILCGALEEVVTGGALTPRTRGLLQHAVDSMLRRRGRPGSSWHAALRTRQAGLASEPDRHALAQLVATRLEPLAGDVGVDDAGALTAPVRQEEARGTTLPAGTEIPASIQRLVRRAQTGTVEDLIAAGLIQSAEQLGPLARSVAVRPVTAVYRDATLRSLMAAHYQRFYWSLFPSPLSELPWDAAVAHHRRPGDDTREEARAALHRLGGLMLNTFPASTLPRPLLIELAALAELALGPQAGKSMPWLTEVAADHFTGSFPAEFPAVARIASELLSGSLYERYYGIDYRHVRTLDGTSAFNALCLTRAGITGTPDSIAARGAVIEQAQILTTHNLATLVHRFEIRPIPDWPTLARKAFAQVITLAASLPHDPRPLAVIRRLGRAWRHLIFYLSLPSRSEPLALLSLLADDLEREPEPVQTTLQPALAGLVHIAGGGKFATDGTTTQGHRLLGWTIDQHWMLPNATKWT